MEYLTIAGVLSVLRAAGLDCSPAVTLLACRTQPAIWQHTASGRATDTKIATEVRT